MGKSSCWNEEKQRKTIFPWGNEQPTEQNANLLESYYWGCTEIGSYPNGMSPIRMSSNDRRCMGMDSV